jgi:hypothetical protein
MFGQHPGYFKAVFLKQTRIIRKNKKQKTKNKKLSSMNKSCEKNQQHIVKIFYMWMFCITLKERNTKRFVQNWHSPSHPSTEWS